MSLLLTEPEKDTVLFLASDWSEKAGPNVSNLNPQRNTATIGVVPINVNSDL